MTHNLAAATYGSILSDNLIRVNKIVEPCVDKQKNVGEVVVPSWGIQSFGYDMRLDKNEFAIFKNNGSELVIDPMNFNKDNIVDVVPCSKDENGLDYWVLPSHTTALGSTIEMFNIPENVTGVVLGKSTYSRCGLVINCTPMEAGWSGNLVVELHNSTPLPIKIYADGGIAQVLFFSGPLPENTYGAGKYQDQRGLTYPK